MNERHSGRLNTHKGKDTPQQYEEKKVRVVAELNQALARGATVGLGKKTSNLFRSRKQSDRHLIDVTDFNKVISVDEENLLAEVEGMTTFDDFTRETLKYGLLPAVVPELKSITVGGAMAGIAIESSSFKYGLMHETVVALEVLTGSGAVVPCLRTGEHQDLFFGFPNSYGTLGYALKLTVRLVRAKKYVELKHQKFDTAEAYFQAVKKACGRKDLDYVDGTVFDEHSHYLTTARFVDSAPFVSNYTYMQIYYQSIATKSVDYLTAYDYIWRWDTDWFWCSKNFGLQNPLLRIFARPWLRSTAYWKIMRWNRKYQFSEKLLRLRGIERQDESVIQDVQIPLEHAHQFLAFFHQAIGIRPIWICPTKSASQERYPTYKLDTDQLYINFGFWDVVPLPDGAQEGFFNRKVEQEVDQLQGCKSLYSTVFYEEKAFWQHYDRPNYQILKERYDPQGKLGDLYEKTVRRQ
jgi:FAD/FMN-containing dehydrogenase